MGALYTQQRPLEPLRRSTGARRARSHRAAGLNGELAGDTRAFLLWEFLRFAAHRLCQKLLQSRGCRQFPGEMELESLTRWGEVPPPGDDALAEALLDDTAAVPFPVNEELNFKLCLLYTSDAADE